jgi:hypothetical protein
MISKKDSGYLGTVSESQSSSNSKIHLLISVSLISSMHHEFRLKLIQGVNVARIPLLF